MTQNGSSGVTTWHNIDQVAQRTASIDESIADIGRKFPVFCPILYDTQIYIVYCTHNNFYIHIYYAPTVRTKQKISKIVGNNKK